MSTLKKITKRSEMGVLVPLLLLWIITGCFNKNFFSSMSMSSLFRSISVTLLGSIGATFVFSCGMMDLSVGAVYGLAGMVSGLLMVNAGLPPIVAMLAAFLVAALFGLLNGFTINTLGLPAFISTLRIFFMRPPISATALVGKGHRVIGRTRPTLIPSARASSMDFMQIRAAEP